MTGSELAERLSRASVTVDQLAESMNRHRDEVSGWLTSRRSLPGSLTQALEWHLAVLDRERQMRDAGIPECAWVERRAGEIKGSRRAFEQYLAAVEAHVATCEICRRRDAFAATLPPLPPGPLPAHVRLLGRIAAGVGRLPKWARPAAVGALIVGAWTLLRAVMMVGLGQAPVGRGLLLAVLGAIAVGAYGGLVGGVAYSLVRGPSRRLGRAGDYVTGVVCLYAYLAAFGIPAVLFTNDETFRSPTTWILFLVLGTFFGLLIGHSWFRTRT